MLGTRFEQYTAFEDGLPFVFTQDITRTDTFYSAEANWHENLEIQLCTKGKGRVLLDEKSTDVSEKDFVVVNSEVIHHTSTDDFITYDCLIFDSDFCKKLGVDISSVEFEITFKSEEMYLLFERIKETKKANCNACKKARLYGISAEILALLREKHTASEKSTAGKRQEFEAVKGAIKYIRENYMNKIYLDDIAFAVFTDKYALSRMFKRVTGQTPVKYINGYRCRKASYFIAEGRNVNEAARECGFTNMSFFTKTFKHHMGKSPSMIKNSREKS